MQFFPLTNDDFDQFTLNDIELLIYAIHMCSAFIVWFCIALLLFPEDTKRMSWAITLLNSFIMSFASALYIFKKLPEGFFTFGVHKESVFHGRDNFSAIVCLLFAVANFMDLLMGVIFYRDRLQFLTTFIHHPLFMFISYESITGNMVTTEMTPFTQGFLWMMIEEIPTFVLALGSIFPMFRLDAIFGLTFFLLRIVYHGYATSYAILSKTDLPICAFMCLSMIFHMIWFVQWITSYRKTLKRKKEISTGKTTLNKARKTTNVGGSPLVSPNALRQSNVKLM